MAILKSKGVRWGATLLLLIGTLIVLYDLFLAEEKKEVFESLGFFIFAIGLLLSSIGGGLKKKGRNDKSKE